MNANGRFRIVSVSVMVWGAMCYSDVLASSEDPQANKIRREAVKLLGSNWQWPFGNITEINSRPELLLDGQRWQKVHAIALSETGEASDEEMVEFVQKRGVTTQHLDGLEETLNCGKEPIRKAFREYATIRKWYLAKVAEINVKQEELDELIELTQERAKIAVIEFRADLDEVPEQAISEQQLVAYYNEHREKAFEPGKSPGYLMGPQVSIEYIGVKAADLIAQMDVKEEEIRARFDREVKENERWWQASHLTHAEQEDYDTVREHVKAIIQDDRARAQIGQAMERLGELLAEPWQNVQIGKNGFKIAPQHVRTNDYWDDVYQQIKSEYVLPWRKGRTGFYGRKNARDMPDVGSLFRRSKKTRKNSNVGMSIASPFFMFDVEGVFNTIGEVRSKEFAMALYEPCAKPIYSVFDGAEFDQFFYRVVGTRKPGVGSFEQMRPYVLHDLRRSLAFDKMATEVAPYIKMAEQHGLKHVWNVLDKEEGRRIKYHEPNPFPRVRLVPATISQRTAQLVTKSSVEGFWSSDALVDETFSFADRLRAIPPLERPAYPVFGARLPLDYSYGIVEFTELIPAGEMSALKNDLMNRAIMNHKTQALRYEIFSEAEINKKYEALSNN